jgi:hypothetical protein
LFHNELPEFLLIPIEGTFLAGGFRKWGLQSRKLKKENKKAGLALTLELNWR